MSLTGTGKFSEHVKILTALRKAKEERELTKEEAKLLADAEACEAIRLAKEKEDKRDSEDEMSHKGSPANSPPPKRKHSSDDEDDAKVTAFVYNGEDIDQKMDNFFGFMVQRHITMLKKDGKLSDSDVVAALLGSDADAGPSGNSKGKGIPGKKSKSSVKPSEPSAKASDKGPSSAATEKASSSKDSGSASIDDLLSAAVSDPEEDKAEDDQDESDSQFLSQFFDIEEGFGEPFSSAIKEILEAGLLRDFPVEQLKELDKRHLMPVGCEETLFIPSVNKPIWREVSTTGKQRDKSLQNMQSYFVKACIPLMREMQVRVAERDRDSVARLSDVLKYIGCGYRYINAQRKQLMSPEMAAEYRPLCQVEYPISTQLFGEDLAKQMLELETTSKIGRQIVRKKQFTKPPPPRKPKYSKYSYDKPSYGYNKYKSSSAKPTSMKAHMSKKLDFLDQQGPSQGSHQSRNKQSYNNQRRPHNNKKN